VKGELGGAASFLMELISFGWLVLLRDGLLEFGQ